MSTLLARIHDAGVHQASLCELAEASIAPALSAMRLMAAQVELQRRQLEEEGRQLKVGGEVRGLGRSGWKAACPQA
jgi:hypothetical protein